METGEPRSTDFLLQRLSVAEGELCLSAMTYLVVDFEN